MPQPRISRSALRCALSSAAFLAAAMMVFPARADDAALAKQLNDLKQQVQDQQAQIDSLANQLAGRKKQAEKSHNQKAQAPHKLVARSPATKPEQAAAQRPGVVAPLEPTSLGTLRMSELTHPGALAAVSQAPPPAQPAAPVVAPVAVAAPISAPAAVAPPPASAPVAAVASPAPAAAPGSGQPAHVGAAPPNPAKPPDVPALANVGGVLTPYGRVVMEPFVEYSHSSVNSFEFNGVQVIPAFLLGTVVADQTSRDLVTAGLTARAGVSDRLELELRLPYVYRQDSLTSSIPNTANETTTNSASGSNLGDIEVAAHYQINDGQEDWPFFIGNLRYKSDTGTSPYDVAYNADGSARSLATGSGFQAIEPSVTVIYPSDPAILFGNIGYIHSFAENINRNVAGNAIGNVAPGDTYLASVGMGVALNDKLSFTLGYEHDYVLPTATVIGGVSQNSDALQIGSALSGISYKLNDRVSINLNLASGVTRDAPDEVVTLRVPVSLQAF